MDIQLISRSKKARDRSHTQNQFLSIIEELFLESLHIILLVHQVLKSFCIVLRLNSNDAFIVSHAILMQQNVS
jgi:hypothetical protein